MFTQQYRVSIELDALEIWVCSLFNMVLVSKYWNEKVSFSKMFNYLNGCIERPCDDTKPRTDVHLRILYIF